MYMSSVCMSSKSSYIHANKKDVVKKFHVKMVLYVLMMATLAAYAQTTRIQVGSLCLSTNQSSVIGVPCQDSSSSSFIGFKGEVNKPEQLRILHSDLCLQGLNGSIVQAPCTAPDDSQKWELLKEGMLQIQSEPASCLKVMDGTNVTIAVCNGLDPRQKVTLLQDVPQSSVDDGSIRAKALMAKPKNRRRNNHNGSRRRRRRRALRFSRKNIQSATNDSLCFQAPEKANDRLFLAPCNDDHPGQKFSISRAHYLRAASSNFCFKSSPDSKFIILASSPSCKDDGRWVYNTVNRQFLNTKKNLCIQGKGNNQLTLSPCQVGPKNQQFVMAAI